MREELHHHLYISLVNHVFELSLKFGLVIGGRDGLPHRHVHCSQDVLELLFQWYLLQRVLVCLIISIALAVKVNIVRNILEVL